VLFGLFLFLMLGAIAVVVVLGVSLVGSLLAGMLYFYSPEELGQPGVPPTPTEPFVEERTIPPPVLVPPKPAENPAPQETALESEPPDEPESLVTATPKSASKPSSSSKPSTKRSDSATKTPHKLKSKSPPVADNTPKEKVEEAPTSLEVVVGRMATIQKAEVAVQGSVPVRLENGRQKYPLPASVLPGKYQIYAQFNGKEWVQVGRTRIQSDQPVTVRCNERMANCRVERGR
jgi:hypothetical protein